MSREYWINIISWSDPIQEESHLQSLSRNGDGLKKVDMTGGGDAIEDIAGEIGFLEDSPAFDILVNT
jgi:hypothetical protein